MFVENLPTLKIHKLTSEQYERERAAGRLEENAIYLTPDIPELPEVTNEDNGKFLRVVNGVPTWVKLSNAEEAGF